MANKFQFICVLVSWFWYEMTDLFFLSLFLFPSPNSYTESRDSPSNMTNRSTFDVRLTNRYQLFCIYVLYISLEKNNDKWKSDNFMLIFLNEKKNRIFSLTHKFCEYFNENEGWDVWYAQRRMVHSLVITVLMENMELIYFSHGRPPDFKFDD